MHVGLSKKRRGRPFRHGSTAQAGTVPLAHIIRNPRPAPTSILADRPRRSGVMIVTISGASRRSEMVYDPR